MIIRLLTASAMSAAICLTTASAQETAPLSEGPVPFDAVPADAASPFGGMSLTPTRVVLEPGKTTGQVNLYNSGASPVTYRIEAVELEALEGGGYARIEDDEAPSWSAARWLRYAPRQITLEPGERQVVKILARAPRDTTPGEYRSHLRFSSIPTVEDVSDDEPAAPAEGQERSVAVSVGLEYRITLPVLLRVGELQGGAEIVSAAVEADPDTGNSEIAVTLKRTGDRSEYGVLKAFDAAGEQVAQLRGVVVLPPLEKRIMRMNLTDGAATPVRVVYEREGTGGQAGLQLAEATIN